MTALLELRHISKYFGNVTALKDISTGVRRRRGACVLGDNGAGKSTLIKILSGVHQPTGGTLIDGEPVGSLRRGRRWRGHLRGLPGPRHGSAARI